MISFTIIVPLYNKGTTIIYTLESVLAQTYTRFKILIIDDGSTDNGAEVVKEFDDSRIRLIQKENGGVSSARNLGIENANYEFIAFLDADDTWEANYLEEQAKLINDFPQAGMWGCGWGYESESGKTDIEHGPPNEFRGVIDNYWTMKKKSNIFWSSAVVIKKEVISKTGLFDERIRIGEDLDMWYRIILKYPVVFYNKTLVWYHQDAENRAMKKLTPLQYILPYYIEKYQTIRHENPEFCKYFDSVCLGLIYPYLLKGQNQSEIKRILREIEFTLQPFRKSVQFRFPRFYNVMIKILAFLR